MKSASHPNATSIDHSKSFLVRRRGLVSVERDKVKCARLESRRDDCRGQLDGVGGPKPMNPKESDRLLAHVIRRADLGPRRDSVTDAADRATKSGGGESAFAFESSERRHALDWGRPPCDDRGIM